MTAQILNGKNIAADIEIKLKKEVSALQSSPGLAVILVGDNPASQSYVRHKQNACKRIGIASTLHHLAENTTQAELKDLINTCNHDNNVHGILLQLPLPKHINGDELLECIDPKKDVDGFHPYNMGRLVQRLPTLRPCTPKGVMTLLKHTGESLIGKHAVIVGASNIVGRPMALELLMARCTVTICHSATQDLDEQIKRADIVVAATGRYGIIQGQWIKPGAIIIDVGFNRFDDGSISGDIDLLSASDKASWITPVPGGVGPMTVITLMQNTLQAYRHLQ